uniref:NADH-ubiquinone oxidoreductase chain 6 n=1 Tax=Timarcha goettingensis TaxID=79522 RepID=A0A0S2MQ56_9CUCU|nr:NADH deshydrogenase subunit 6 [Timarcha goettingensis]
MKFLMIFMTLLSMIFLFLNHPLSFGLILLFQTIMISLMTGLMMYNFWFSYILFLVMIGGMLVLFIYMTSVASNEKFKFSFKIFSLIISFFIISSIMLFSMDTLISNYNLNLTELINYNNLINYKLNLNKYLNFPNNWIMMMLIIYLLIILIVIVKIIDTKQGPLRQKY